MIPHDLLIRRRAQWWDRHLYPEATRADVERWWQGASAQSSAARDVYAGMLTLEAQLADHPLARARLWEPECRTCLRPQKGAPWRGVTLEHIGPGRLHRCPVCGVTEDRTSQRLAVQSLLATGVFDGFLMGGNRCLSGETLIEDADTGERIRIDAIDRPITVWATTPDGARVRATAYPTARKGPDPLYTVTLSTGAAFTATRAHLVMGEDLRWRPVAALRPGARIHGEALVVSVDYARTDYHYDLIVPGPNCFVVDGVTHHNSGKTKAGVQLDVAFAYGRSHFAVQAWAKFNRLDVSRIQPGPGRVWACSLTWSDALEYLRPAVDAVAPGPLVAKRSRWSQNQQAEIRLPNGGVVVNKCVEQGRGGFQGSAIHLLHFDEEPLDAEVIEEGGMRCVDYAAPTLQTMTSLSGWTEHLTKKLGYRLTGERPPPGLVDVEIHGEDNPFVNPEILRQRAVGVRSASRLQGAIVDPTGRVHPDFERSVHVVPAFTPPAGWPRFTGIDFGFRDPFVCLWVAQAPDDVLHVYREHYERERTTAHHAQAIHDAELCPACWPRVNGARAIPGTVEWWAWITESARTTMEAIQARTDPRLVAKRERTQYTRCCACDGTGRADPEPMVRWADPADAEAIASLGAQYGLHCYGAIKSRSDSYDALCRRLARDAGGRPHLVVHDSCPNTIREMETLRWGKVTVHEEVVVKGDDHAWDVLRYLSLGMERHGYTRGGAAT